MENEETVLLASCEFSNLSLVPEYGTVSWTFKNIVVHFDLPGFSEYSKGFCRFDFDYSSISGENGRDLTIIGTIHRDINLMLNKREFEILRQMFNQAEVELEIWQILYGNRKNSERPPETLRVLSEHHHWKIVQCPGCGQIAVYFDGFIFCYEKEYFRKWAGLVLKMDFVEEATCLGLIRYLLVFCRMHEYGFHFFQTEFESFQQLMADALIDLEIEESLK